MSNRFPPYVDAKAIVPLGIESPRTGDGVEAQLRTIGIGSDDSMWLKVGVGDTDWEPILIGVDGEFRANIQLVKALDLALPEGTLSLSSYGKGVRVHDGETAGGHRAQDETIAKPTDIFKPRPVSSFANVHWIKGAKMLWIGSVSAPTFTVRSDTGYAAILRWDGVMTDAAGTGVAGANITVSAGINPIAPYNSVLPKFVAIFPCAANGQVSGNVTYLNIASQLITSLDVNDLTSLTTLICSSNPLSKLDVSGLSNLTNLACNNCSIKHLNLDGANAITNLNCRGNLINHLDLINLTELEDLDCSENQLIELELNQLTALTNLNCGSNSLTNLDVSNCPLITFGVSSNGLNSLDISMLTSLETFSCDGNPMTTLDASGLASLSYINCLHCQLTTVNINGCTSLHNLFCSNNQITSISAINVAFATYSSSYYFVARLNDNALNAAALNQFYTDLLAGESTLIVTDNPGTATHTPSIATAKGYTVID